MPRLFLVRRATTELSIAPENGNYQSRDFLWRLSSATVELEESTFTSLPDFDRIILTLEGGDGHMPRRGTMDPSGGVFAPSV